MDTVYRYFAALYAFRTVAQFINQCRNVVDKMTDNPSFPTLAPLLAQTTEHLDVLDDAEKDVFDGPKNAVAVRNTALFVVKSDMRQLRTSAQVAADANLVQSKAVIEGAGMFASRRANKPKPLFSAKYRLVPGLLHLIAKAVKRAASYHWQMRTGEGPWSDLPPTTKSSTTVSGLTPATICSFRFRTFTKGSFSDWSTVIDVITH